MSGHLLQKCSIITVRAADVRPFIAIMQHNRRPGRKYRSICCTFATYLAVRAREWFKPHLKVRVLVHQFQQNGGCTVSDAYKAAGVDIAAGNEAVERIKKHVQTTFRPEVLGGIGGVGGPFPVDARPRGDRGVVVSLIYIRHRRRTTLSMSLSGRGPL